MKKPLPKTYMQSHELLSQNNLGNATSMHSTENPFTRTGRVQRRGLERKQVILDAAEEILKEQGYEAATLKAIGDRAGIPTASMYHYFPDRNRVDLEIAQRHIRELNKLLNLALQSDELGTLSEIIGAIIDIIVDYFRKYPSFLELWYAGRRTTLDAMIQSFDLLWSEQLWQILIERNLIDSNTPRLVVRLAFEAGDRLFEVAFRLASGGDEVTIDESRRLVAAYLETYASHK